VRTFGIDPYRSQIGTDRDLSIVNRAVFPAWHLATVDLGGLPGSLLSDAARLERTLGRAFADIAVVWFHHEFSPAGVSMTGASRAARVAVHTWP